MASNNTDQFTIPLAIDPRGFLNSLEEMDQGLSEITNKAKGATTAINEAFIASGKAGETLAAKMEVGAKAAKTVSDAAKAAGVDLSKAFSGDNIKTTGLDAKITAFTAKLRDAAGKPVDFKFNINQSAVKVLVDQLTKAKNETQAFNLVLSSAKDRLSTLQAGSAAFNELNAQIQTAETFVKNLTGDVEGLKEEIATPAPGSGIGDVGDEAEQTAPKVKTLKQELKEMVEQLARMERDGKAGTAEFVALLQSAGDLQDQLGDTRQQIRELASDTKGLDAGITAIRGLAGAFAVGQGALAAFGEQSEEAAAAIQKVQGALAILQGVQEVANVLNKDSALMVYLKTFATRADTAATVAHTGVVEADTVATEAATVATEGWTAALLLNPITAIVAVLAVATYSVYKFAESQKAAGMSADQFNKYLEAQQGLLEEDIARINRRTSFEEAIANSARRNQSVLQEIRLSGLKSQKAANQVEFGILSESVANLDENDKNYLQAKAELVKKLDALEKKRQDLFTQISVEEINLEKTKNDERLKLEGEFLKERQTQAAVEVEIGNQARNYLNQIQDAKLAEMKDGQDKELKILDQALKVKIQGLETEQAAKLQALTDQKANYAIERELADENGKKIIDQQVEDLNKQIALTKQNGEKVKALELELTKQTEVEKLEVIKKYAEQRRDIEFQVANTLLGIQKETAEQKAAVLKLAAQHEIDLVERTNQDRALKDEQIAAIELKLKKDIADSNLEFQLKQLDLEKLSNETRLMEQKKFFDKSRDGQALAALLLAQNQLDIDQKKLEALKKAGKDESDEQVKQLRNNIARLKGEMEQLEKDVKPQDIFELLFPDDQKAQGLAKQFMKTLDEVGKAVDAYTSLVVSQYQRQIEAQKKLVEKDNDSLDDLKGRLKEEQALKDKGYANNVDGIRKEIEEKNKQREVDIKKQEEYEKKMAEIQRRAIAVQTAIQASNLITASANILLETSKLGPLGVALGIVSVGAMITAFISAKTQAFEAANSGATIMEKGGLVKGKSHAQGGQKYFAPDASGGIVELEADEFVTSKRQTEKYFPLLQVINDDKLKDMDDRALVNMLAGLGVSLMNDHQHREVLAEAKQFQTHQINQVNVINAGPETPHELKSIDRTLQMMMNKSNNTTTVTEEGGYIVTRKGNFTKRVKKQP